MGQFIYPHITLIGYGTRWKLMQYTNRSNGDFKVISGWLIITIELV